MALRSYPSLKLRFYLSLGQLVETNSLWNQPQIDYDSDGVILKVTLGSRWEWFSNSVLVLYPN